MQPPMEMDAFQALRLLRRTAKVPRLQAKQLNSLLRIMRASPMAEMLLPRSLIPLLDLVWLAQVTPPTRTLQ